jgi:thioredoxin 1
MTTVTVTEHTFVREVLESPLPVLVDFWAAWCAPCRMVAPVLEELSEQFSDRLKIAKVDVDAAPALSSRLHVQSIPTLMLFRGGQPTQVTQGALPKAQLITLLEKWVPELKGPLIDVATLAQSLDKHRVLDLRRPEDFARSHLAGSECVDPAELEARLGELGKRTSVVLVCRTGEISRAEAQRLAGLGYSVTALEKGLLEWEGAGKSTLSNKEEEALAASRKGTRGSE